MRIVGGRARGIPLLSGANESCRPTTDRLKETLFNMLGPIEDLQVVDLFSGSGALGLEALSRGASHVVLVENDRLALKAIKANVAKVSKSVGTGCGRIEAISATAEAYVKGGLRGLHPDLILLDPPYAIASEVMQNLLVSEALYTAAAEECLLVIEHPRNIPTLEHENWQLLRRKDCGETAFSFWQKLC